MLLDSGDLLTLTAGTVIVAVKSHCDGCRSYLDRPTVAGWNVVPIALDAEIAEANDVVVSSALLAALDIRSAPFFVALDGAPLEVVNEGVPFDLAHLREILPPR